MKVLIADDDPITRRILQAMVQEWGLEPVLARDGTEAWEVLSGKDAPLLAILDWMMPGLDGLEVCRKLRAKGNAPYTHVLMLTGRGETEDLVQAINAGADDFIAKPFNKQELRVRLRAGQRIVELEESLRYQATHDPLTGIYNHALILETLQRELARAARSRKPTGVLMADLDHFKRVNDSYGHPAGDTVLREIARRLGRGLRVFDALGRYGGEEFLIILPDCDAAEAREVAERVRGGIRAAPVAVPAGAIPVTISIGVAVARPGQDTADQVVQRADQALYRAKQLGRDRVELDDGSTASSGTAGAACSEKETRDRAAV